MNRMHTLLAASAALLFMIGGCGSQVVPSAGPRPPTQSWEVQILQNRPSKYEILGVVETTENLKLGPNATADEAFNALKKKAAALGATGLLLEAEAAPIRATVMYNGRSFQVPIDKSPATKAMATAVYIIKP
jgi:hypothetical protein